MKKFLTVKDIAQCTNGELIIGSEDFVCVDFTSDTRCIKKDDTYIGLKGENLNGSTLWKEALNRGAKVVIVQDVDFSNKKLDMYSDKVIIKVNDTMQALYDIAKCKRNLYGSDFPIVAVTGSVGKTSTKDMIASVISQKYNTLKTEANNNNNVGLPFTILKLKDHEIAVIEMGMNHFGEISNLSKITKPTISVITNVGTSHIGNLGSRENILKAKLEILDGMTKPALVINNDNDLLHKWAEENLGKMPINTYGIANKSEVYADNIKLNENSSTCKFHYENEEIDIQIPIGGEHFVYNAMCAFLVGKLLGLSKEEIKAGIESFELTKKRMEVTKLKNNITVINDSYNASYESMKAALSYLASMNTGRKIAVLGDMFELGDFAKELHEKVGIEVANNKIDILLCCGENSKYIAEQAILGGLESSNVFYLDNIEQIEEKLTEILKENDNVLIKASHGMNFMKLADNLINSKVTR